MLLISICSVLVSYTKKNAIHENCSVQRISYSGCVSSSEEWHDLSSYLIQRCFPLNSHTAAIAAGNNGIPVRMHGHEFGKASGMAPRAR
jgi:hypothetical protein